MLIVTILGILSIYIVYKVRSKENRLNIQDKFIQNSMHEIKIPLSIITLNNELRELEYGKDDYSIEIDSALKILKNSYSDMNYMVLQNKNIYKIEIFNLEEILKQRINYFKSIAKANNKNIQYKIFSNCNVRISLVELTRLIDNNISNAIKYSNRNDEIFIKLSDNILSFQNKGVLIKDTKKIFNKYYRENNIIGGHGIGLSIVKDIAKKYKIKIDVLSTKEEVKFTYTLQCYLSTNEKDKV
jgi:signal transduction histidine kinase